MTVFVDANVILDVVTSDARWSEWSVAQLDALSLEEALAINDVVYAEVSTGYDTIERMDELIEGMNLRMVPLSRPALFLAAKVHQKYRRSGGTRRSVLPDFFIGAQASIEGARLLTRDTRRYRSYFPQLELIAPEPPGIG